MPGPAAALNLSRVAVTASTLGVRWSELGVDNGAVLLGCELDVNSTATDRGNGTHWRQVCKAKGGSGACNVTGLTAGTVYCLHLRCWNHVEAAGGPSICHRTAGARPPLAPEGLVARQVASHALAVRWRPPLDDGGAPVLRYRVATDDWWASNSTLRIVRTLDHTAALVLGGSACPLGNPKDSGCDLMPAAPIRFAVSASNTKDHDKHAGRWGPWSAVRSVETEGRLACGNAADVDKFRAARATLKPTVQGCLTGCILSPHRETCAASCISTNLGLSGLCSQCWVKMGDCTLRECKWDCLKPKSSACAACTEAHCFPQACSCTGIPLAYFPP